MAHVPCRRPVEAKSVGTDQHMAQAVTQRVILISDTKCFVVLRRHHNLLELIFRSLHLKSLQSVHTGHSTVRGAGLP